MALPVNCSTHLIPAYYLQLTYYIYRPRKDERLSWPSWLTCSGRFTHISGHPSAAGRAQDRESSPVRDRRSTTVPRAGKNTEIASSAGRERASTGGVIYTLAVRLDVEEVAGELQLHFVVSRRRQSPHTFDAVRVLAGVVGRRHHRRRSIFGQLDHQHASVYTRVEHRHSKSGARLTKHLTTILRLSYDKKGKGSPYSTAERRVPEVIPVLGSQPAGDMSHKPGGSLPLLSARPAVEVCMGMGKTGIPWVPRDSHGNGSKISHGMEMGWEWEISAWEWELRRGSWNSLL